MSIKKIIQENLILVLGLILPLLLMLVFILATLIPPQNENPPQYDMIYSLQDYGSSGQAPVLINYMVKDGVLYAQFTKNTTNSYYGFRKLYRYVAKTGKVEQLPLELPKDYEHLTEMKQEVVQSTKDLKLDPNLESPDGYQLSYANYNQSNGLLADLFWGSKDRSPCLLKKQTCIKFMGDTSNYSYYNYGYLQFIGWVKP